jgi:hypothetical protein
MRTLVVLPLLLLPLLLALSVAGCGRPRTMLVVEVQSNLSVPDALDEVRVVVTHAGKQIQNLPFSLAGGTRRLPLRVGLLSPSGGGTEVSVTVTGLRARGTVVAEDAITSFIEGKSLLLEMFLASECAAYDCKDPNKTCTVGPVCIDKHRPAAALPVFQAHADGGLETIGRDAAVEAIAEVRAEAPPADVGGEAAAEVPSCVPTGAEDCFNGRDDDCNGAADCADSACAPVAVCVPAPAGAVGTTVTTTTCPAGFAAATSGVLNSGLSGGAGCTGCACGAGTVASCSATVSLYTDQTSCQAAVPQLQFKISTVDPDMCPIPYMQGQVYGGALSAWAVSTGGCQPSGAPARTTPMWAASTHFCAAEKVGPTGCAAGSVCMARPAGKACVLLDGAAATCPAGTAPPTPAALYTGFSDLRTCGACACTAAGQSCDGVSVHFGSDYSCGVDYGTLTASSKNCLPNNPNGIYVPGFYLKGAPTPPSCAPSSAVSGALTPTGPRTLCCLP